MTQPDSIIPDPYNPFDWNRYSYVRNNPINYNDPTGHSVCEDSQTNGCGGYKPSPISSPRVTPPVKGAGHWEIITSNGNGVVTWYQYSIINDPLIRSPDDLPNQPFFRMQGAIKLNGTNYYWKNGQWNAASGCAFQSSTQCITPYEVKTETNPVTGAVHHPSDLPGKQNSYIYIRIPTGDSEFSNGILVNTRDECPACVSTGVDILTITAWRHNSYNGANGIQMDVYIWEWVIDVPRSKPLLPN